MPSEAQSQIVLYLVSKAKFSDRPESLLRTICAALKHFFLAKFNQDIIDSEILRLIQGLIRSETVRPRERTKVMPIEPFIRLFTQWNDNHLLPIANLRQKAITLLALTALCRPSDIAPQTIFRRSQITQNPDSSLTLRFFGIKNDRQRQGFEFRLHRADNKKVDPVECLLTYLEKTSRFTTNEGPVFITLKHPFRQVDSSTVSRILNESIKQAGLPSHFTAKCFRPTGATTAMYSGADAREVRQLGRWKSEDVFYQHYVYPTSKSNITSSVLSSKLELF